MIDFHFRFSEDNITNNEIFSTAIDDVDADSVPHIRLMFGRRMCSSQRERSVLLVFRQSCGGDQQHQGVVWRTGQGSV